MLTEPSDESFSNSAFSEVISELIVSEVISQSVSNLKLSCPLMWARARALLSPSPPPHSKYPRCDGHALNRIEMLAIAEIWIARLVDAHSRIFEEGGIRRGSRSQA